ncbi:hypothetical protein ACFW2I_08720 [Streptomyces nigra]|uniref:hypothetical protein n=1 Tax=Streptomyces nigra TaxID=1827580 RepID=UPI003678E63E
MRSEHDRLELAVLAALDIDPTALEPGPDDPIRTPGWRERVHPDSPTRRPCSACSTPASYTRLVRLEGLGPRWVDSCREHMIAGWRARK